MENYRLVTTLQELRAYLAGAAVVAFDFETSPDEKYRDDPKAALDPHRAHIVGVSFSVEEGTGVYVPVAHKTGGNIENADALWAWLKGSLFESKSVVKAAHNLAFETMFLYAMGILVKSPCYDTIAAGDSFNDLGMIQASKAGFLFKSTEQIKKDHPELPAYEEFDQLLSAIKAAL